MQVWYIYIYIYISFLLWRCGPTWVMAFSFLMFLDHTQRRTTFRRTPLDEWSARRRDLYLTTQHSQQTNIHAPGGMRTHDLSRRAAADLGLRPRGQERQISSISFLLCSQARNQSYFPKSDVGFWAFRNTRKVWIAQKVQVGLVLDNRETVLPFPAGAPDFSRLECVQTDCTPPPPSPDTLPVDTRSSFFGAEA